VSTDLSVIDVHQHVWTEPLIHALSLREELPFVRFEHDLTILYAAGERPYVLDPSTRDAGLRTEVLDRDGIGRALVCISSPLGIEALPREQSLAVIDAYHAGALALGDRFGIWGAVPLERPEPADVDRALELGCVGVSVPAGAIASLEALTRFRGVLGRLQERNAPLFVHPGPGRPWGSAQSCPALRDPLWWPALTAYVAQMQAAWLVFATAGRLEHPQLRVVFAMFAGLAPQQADRLHARGGPQVELADANTFYECSSYGPDAWSALESRVGASQLLFGSDRPMARPEPVLGPQLPWWHVADNTRRALGEPVAAVRPQRAATHRHQAPGAERALQRGLVPAP
jgi:6-methylsalicylate decarboxylase